MDPPLKKKLKLDFGLCFICQTKGPMNYTNFIKTPSIEAIEKLVRATSERFGYGESALELLNNRLHSSSVNELLENGITYHKNCYNATHKHYVESAKARFKKEKSLGDLKTMRGKKKRTSFC